MAKDNRMKGKHMVTVGDWPTSRYYQAEICMPLVPEGNSVKLPVVYTDFLIAEG